MAGTIDLEEDTNLRSGILIGDAHLVNARPRQAFHSRQADTENYGCRYAYRPLAPLGGQADKGGHSAFRDNALCPPLFGCGVYIRLADHSFARPRPARRASGETSACLRRR
jgi:hypothetical protein